MPPRQVPIYVFGESDLYEHSSFLLGPRLALMRNYGVAIPLAYGLCGLLPFPRPVTAVAGAPIAPPDLEGRAPTSAEVDALHAQYVTALTELFEAHKAEHGYGRSQLEIE